MLALRLIRAARPAVHLRRLLVSAASAGTAFLLLSSLGYGLHHPEAADAAALRLAWCAVPLAATVYLALAVARTDPGTRPRPGLSAVGLGPARLMALSALTTALSCALGALLALLAFLRLRGDLPGGPFDGAADFLAADQPLPVPAALTLLAVVPAAAAATAAVALRPKDPRPARRTPRTFGRFGTYGTSPRRDTFGAYGRFGARRRGGTPVAAGAAGPARGAQASGAAADLRPAAAVHAPAEPPSPGTAPAGRPGRAAAGTAPGTASGTAEDGTSALPGVADTDPAGLPWGVALVTAGLAAQAYAGRSAPAPALAVLLGWLLGGTGLVLAGPGLTHGCGRLLQACRPGVLRLLAGRVLMTEAARIGRPLGVVCAVASAGCALTIVHGSAAPGHDPLSALGALVVAGSTLATLLTAAVETRQCRAGTTAALLRLGAPPVLLRGAAALRAVALVALFGPLVLVIAALSALPLSR
ncbi:hypothetical protein [Streptomyces sp. NPDC017095]|uniref:hypothetical protein n=1 Tax=Streptomyces sp. NPDC017095 TaxID=3364977 RepID=UPI0037A903F3